MARIARIQFSGALYHVTFRGNERKDVFRDDSDRERLLASLAQRVEEYGIRLYLFCWMSNHVHLLLQTPNANLSAFMGSWLTSYCTYFNRRHRRRGHLTQGRFSSPLVEENAHLLQLSRYIHLNPVKTNTWKDKPLSEQRYFLANYRWSSYSSYIDRRKRLDFLDYSLALNQVSPIENERNQASDYRKYVEKGLLERDDELKEAMGRSPLAIGSEKFIDMVKERYRAETQARLCLDDVATFKIGGNLVADDVVRVACDYFSLQPDEVKQSRKNNEIKPVLSTLLHRLCGLRQRGIAQHVGVGTGAAVSAHLRKFLQDESGSLQAAYSEIKSRLIKARKNQ